MYSDLMSSTCNWITFQKSTITGIVIPNLFKYSSRILYIPIIFNFIDEFLFPQILLNFFISFYLLFSLGNIFLALFNQLNFNERLLFQNMLFIQLIWFIVIWFDQALVLLIPPIFKLVKSPIYSIFMRDTFNIGGQILFVPLNLSVYPSKIHLFHCLIFTLFMKYAHFIFILSKNQETACALVQSMQNMQILISVLIFKKSFDCVEMMATACMHNNTWRLVDNKKIIAFVHYINWQIENRRLYPN